MSDGKVVIDTELNTEGLKKGLKNIDAKTPRELNEELKKTQAGIEGATKAIEDEIEKYHIEDMSIVRLTADLEELIQKKKDMESEGVGLGVGEYDNTISKIAEIKARLAEYEAGLKNVKDEEDAVGERASIWGRIASGIKTVAKASINGAYKGIKAVGNALKSLKSHADASGNSFKGLARKLLKYGLGVRSFFILFRKLRGYATDALKAMATEFADVDAKMSGVFNAFNQFKASIGTMVQPLLNVLAPVLEYILGILTSITTALGKFFALLSGQNYIYKATKQNQSYAQSLDDTASSADKARNALGKYDELEVIDKDTQGGSSGGGTGAYQYDVEEIDDASKDLFERIKAMFEADDWTEMGKASAELINKGLKAIDWKKIQKTVRDVAKKFATYLNGFIKELDWDEVGKTIAEGFNTAIAFVGEWLSTFDFAEFGAGLGQMVMGWLTNIDFQAVATAIGDAITGVLEFIGAFVKNLDGKEIADSVIYFLASIDWFGILKGLFASIWNIIKFLIESLGSLLLSLMGAILEFITTNVIEPIVDLCSQGLQAIVDILKGIWDAFSNAVTKVFDALYNYTSGIIDSLKQIFNGLCTFISGVFSGDWEKAWEGVKEIFRGIMNGIVGILYGGLNLIIDAFNDLTNVIANALNGLIDGFKNNEFLRLVAQLGGANMGTFDSIMNATGFQFYGSSISHFPIPKLATGAVLPANQPFLAMLGDQKSGTNVEAPLDTIKQAVAEVIAQMGSINNGDIVVEIDGSEVFRAVRNQNDEFMRMNGASAF